MKLRIITQQKGAFKIMSKVRMRFIVAAFFAIVLAFALQGCNWNTPAQPEPVEPELSWPYHQSSVNGAAIEMGEDVFYRSGQLLYHAARADHTLMPWCSQPGCTHDSADCAAWFAQSTCAESGIGAWDGKLLIVVEDPEDPMCDLLERVDPKTGAREPAEPLPKPAYTQNPQVLVRSTIFHRHWIARLFWTDGSVPLSERQFHLLITDLRTGETKEPFCELLEQRCREQYVELYRLTAAGDRLYARASFFREEKRDQMELVVMEQWLVELDPETGAWRKLFRADGLNHWDCINHEIFALMDTGLLLRYDLSTDAQTTAACAEGLQACGMWENRIIAVTSDGDQCILLGTDGQTIARAALPPEHAFAMRADDTVFFMTYDRVPDLYLDLSEYADADFAAQPIQRKDTE